MVLQNSSMDKIGYSPVNWKHFLITSTNFSYFKYYFKNNFLLAGGTTYDFRQWQRDWQYLWFIGFRMTKWCFCSSWISQYSSLIFLPPSLSPFPFSCISVCLTIQGHLVKHLHNIQFLKAFIWFKPSCTIVSRYNSAANSLAREGQWAVQSLVPLNVYSFTKADGVSLQFSDGGLPVSNLNEDNPGNDFTGKEHGQTWSCSSLWRDITLPV